MTDSPHLIPKYQAILKSNGYIDSQISQITVTIPNTESESSTCSCVSVQLENGQKVKLFVKKLLKGSSYSKLLPSGLYIKEVGFFNEILPDLQKYYLEHSNGSSQSMDFFPKCYHANHEEIILENLVASKGYFVNSKFERQDLESVKMVLKNLALFHATSFSMISEIGEKTFLEKYPYLLDEWLITLNNGMLTGVVEMARAICEEILTNNPVPGGDCAIQIFKKHKGQIMSELIQLFSAEESSHIFKVLNLGDVKNNNMLFLKDSLTENLKHLVLIDFQGIRYGSPNLDLLFYFFSTLKIQQRKDWKELLKTYFTQFNVNIELLGKENNNQQCLKFDVSFDDFVEDLKSKLFIGFWFNIMFSLGAAFASINLADAEGDISTYIATAVNKWLKEDPEKGTQIAYELVEFCEEFEEILG